ncbi:MAG: endonuclease MutS2 [Ruminococcus sp.]|nr:endonuclease MutS2 [Ruminococcus sp.]
MDVHLIDENNALSLELPKVLDMLSVHCTSDRAKTSARLIKPSTDLYTVKNEISKTQAALEMSCSYGTPAFYKIDGVQAALKRLNAGSVLSLGELIEVRKLLSQINSLCVWYSKCEDKPAQLGYLFESLYENKYLENKLDTAIVDENELSDDASASLAAIRRKITSAGLKIRQSLEKMIKSPSINRYLRENIITMRDGRFVVPVKSEHKNQIQGFVHAASSSGSTLFIEPAAVVEANNDIMILQAQELEEINRIIKALSYECEQIKEQLESGFKAVCALDVYFAKANLAAQMKASVPEINDDGTIVLRKARHPLIDPKKVVPIDVSLGESYDTLVITGPNTGGKTVLLKTVGLFTLMTMCGLLIPVADGSKISVFKNILVCIGDSQSIEMSLSTFSAHMSQVAEILNRADFESLVLLDELGSGTDPEEGACLAVAIIEQLKAQGAYTIATTHYQELKLYALEADGVENAAFDFDAETLTPTYKLNIGTPGKSNAYEISSKLGLSEQVISRARSLASEESVKLENVLEKLEQERKQAEQMKFEAAQLKAQAQQLKTELEAQTKELEERKEYELEEARREANALLSRVERQSDELVEELDKLRKQKNAQDFSDKAADAKRRQKKAINQMYLDANPITQSDDGYLLPRALKKGDSVTIMPSGKSGVVVGEPDSKGNCFVQLGAMKTKVEVTKLRLNESKKADKPKKGHVSTRGVQSRSQRKISREIDIRGLNCDEGIYELDSFIDEAVLSGVSVITVIHGIGTGVLKNAVRAHLKRHPSVKSSRKGLYGEGEDGVTIVELK